MAISQAEAKKICTYFGTLEGDRHHWESHWQEISDYSLERRNFQAKREPGRQRGVRIYDTTSRDSNNLLAAALHSLLTNPATADWFDLRYEMDILNEMDEAVRFLDFVKKRIRTAFQRPKSGFTTQVAELYQDLSGFGTGVLYIEEDPEIGARFISRPLAETYIDTDHSGQIVVVFRKFSLQAWKAVEFFGDDTPDDIRKVTEKRPEREFEFLHHVRKRAMPTPGKIDASGMAWESVWISLKGKEKIREGGFRENPYMVPRWSVDTGELYGRGPGVDSLPDQKMLNSIWRTFIRNVEKASDPPVLVDHDSVLAGSSVRLTPNAQIVVANDGGTRDPVRYLEHRGQLNWNFEMIESRTKNIQRAFHHEILQAFQDPRMTATQVLELARQSQRILSPTLGRLAVELLEPMIARVYGIESRRGDFPEVPDFLAGQPIKIEYVSPVARAQKQGDAQAIMESFNAALQMAQADPDVMDNVDLDEGIRAIYAANGTPVEAMRSRDGVIQIRRAKAEEAERQQMQQTLMQAGETGAKLISAGASLEAAQSQGNNA